MSSPKDSKSHLYQPKYSQKIVEFIVDKIEGGMTLAEICREYGPPTHSTVPNEKTCYRWKKKYPEFKKSLDSAYQTLIFKFMDEMNDLSKKILRMSKEVREFEVVVDDMGDKDYSGRNLAKDNLKMEIEACKLRHKSLEFMLTRIAPKLVPELKEDSQTTFTNLPPINIINYSRPDKGLSDSSIILGELGHAEKR